jgi:biopolymer transport protein ExbD
MWFKYSIVAVLIFASAPGCSRGAKPRAVTAPTEVAKVRVSADGKVYLNEREIALDELRGEFQRLRRSNGGVWFVDESSMKVK